MTDNPISEFEFAKYTEAGKKRKNEPNQDAIDVIEVENGNSKTILLIIADGMGGHKDGATASRIVVETTSAIYRQTGQSLEYEKILPYCLHMSHKMMRTYASTSPNSNNMGSTAVIAALVHNNIYVANVGDSRAYLLRGREIRQLSFDHSLVGELVRTGALTNMEASKHPARNRLTQSISVQRQTITPFFIRAELLPNDIVLLCTDGLWGVVSEAVIQAVALELPPKQATQKLAALANANQGPDNISVIIARYKPKGKQNIVGENVDETKP